MTEEQLAAIESRLALISPPPWGWDSYSKIESVPRACEYAAREGRGEDTDGIVIFVCRVAVQSGDTATKEGEANARFIEAAPTDVAALLAEVRRLREAIETALRTCPACGETGWRCVRCAGVAREALK